MKATARGTYLYHLDSVRQPVTEPFKLERRSNGHRLTGQRLVDGSVALDVLADYEGRSCTRMQVVWQGSASTRTVSADLEGTELHWKVDDEATRRSVAAGTLLFPLLRVATAPLLAHLQDASRDVVVPNLHEPGSADFLAPSVTARRATRLDDGSSEGAAYRYFGGEYGEIGSDWWIGAHGLPTRYRWTAPDGTWETTLVDLQVKEGFPGF